MFQGKSSVKWGEDLEGKKYCFLITLDVACHLA